MNIKEVKDLIHEVLQSDIREFELEQTGTRIRLKRGLAKETAAGLSLAPHPVTMSFSIPHHPVPEQPATLAAAGQEAEDSALHIITSPIVGTVYSSPSPGTEPYVQVGDHVREGSILCIVEAMKLMNEIPSDVEGEVAAIYVENGHPVEFGQKLFAIRPKQG